MSNTSENQPEGRVDLEMSVYLEHRRVEPLPAAEAVGDATPGLGMNPAHQMPARGMLDPIDTAGTAHGDMPRPSME